MAPFMDRRRGALLALTASITLLAAACGSGGRGSAPSTATTIAPATTSHDGHDDHDGHDMGGEMATADRAAAMLAAAQFQDVETAAAAGYASTIDSLGCFQDRQLGGMGVHYLNESLMDDRVDIAEPEALVYELDADGNIAGLVAHEYIVPIEAWHSSTPPTLFGMAFHQHPTLPLWVLHTWLWKDNPTGVFQDWNPAVRLCPAGVPIFGKDLPAPAPTTTTPATSAQSVAGAAAGGGTRYRPY